MKQKSGMSGAGSSKAKTEDELTSANEKGVDGVRKTQEMENIRSLLHEKTKENEQLKKAYSGMEKKLEKMNTLLLKTEESKSKLEELCRELQRYNKEIREDGVKRMKGLEDERALAVQKLRESLKDIEHTIQEGHGKSDELAADNARLSANLAKLSSEYQEKIAAFADQHDKKDKYWTELGKAKDAEIALLKARLEAAKLMEEKHLLEKEELARSLLEGTARVGGAIESERMLREQVKQYAEKYSALHKSLASSSEAFDKFKRQIDKVNNKLSKVEADASKWKQKYDDSTKTVLVLTMQKKELDEAATVQEKKMKALEALCRSLSSRQDKTDLSQPNTLSSPQHESDLSQPSTLSAETFTTPDNAQ